MTILEQVQADTRDAMKAGERERVGALRMIANALQQDAKEGKGDEVAVLRRERKRRLEAAEAFREGGGADRPPPRRPRRELIETYLPAQLSRRRARGARGRRRRGGGRRRAPRRWARSWESSCRRSRGAPTASASAHGSERLSQPLARRQLTLDNAVAAELAGLGGLRPAGARGSRRLRRPPARQRPHARRRGGRRPRGRGRSSTSSSA